MLEKRILNLAHRGYKAKAPENTLISFELARQIGADGVELDVQKTRDGQLVVIHDETVDRTTNGTGWIKNLDYATIRTWDAGNWFLPKYSGERVPLLAEVLDWAKAHTMFLNIELKTTKVPYQEIEEDVLRLVDQFDLNGQVLYSSFNHFSIQKIKQLNPTAQTGVLYAQPLVEPWLYAKRLGATALHPEFHFVDEALIQGCKAYGIQVNPYTVNELYDLQTMIDLEVDSIISDYPNRLKTLRV